MGWSDYNPDEFSNYAELRAPTMQDYPQGTLDPRDTGLEKGGHIISAILDALQWGPARRGEWAGGSSEVNAPAWGRKPGESPIAATGMAIPWPTTGAMEATGILPIALAAAKSRAELANSGVPSYAAIGKALQDAPGIGENAWNMGKEWLTRLGEKIGGFGGNELQPAMQGAFDVATNQPYEPLLSRILGKHQIYVPHIPSSIEEPLLLKNPGETIDPIAKALGRKDWTGAQGFHTPLNAPEGEKYGGDLVTSAFQNQDNIIPHEYGHFLQRLINAQDNRPWSQIFEAQKIWMN